MRNAYDLSVNVKVVTPEPIVNDTRPAESFGEPTNRLAGFTRIDETLNFDGMVWVTVTCVA